VKKLTLVQSKMLWFIAEHHGGSYMPWDMDPMLSKALHKLVQAGRLTVENTDAGPRYHLTVQGRADAEA